MTIYKKLKFDTHEKGQKRSATISAHIQKELFSRGYQWDKRGDIVQHTECRYLYGEEDGRITFWDGEMTIEKDYFNKETHRLTTYKELKAQAF